LHQAPSVNREVIVSPSTSFARSDAGEDVADGKGRKHRKMRKRRKRKRNAGKMRTCLLFLIRMSGSDASQSATC